VQRALLEFPWDHCSRKAMSDLEAEIVMILADHEKGLKVEGIQAELQKRRNG